VKFILAYAKISKLTEGEVELCQDIPNGITLRTKKARKMPKEARCLPNWEDILWWQPKKAGETLIIIRH